MYSISTNGRIKGTVQMSYENNLKKLTIKKRSVAMEQGLTYEATSTLEHIVANVKSLATIVVWSMHQVTWGIWDGASQVTFPQGTEVDMKFATEIRVFTETEELHVYRNKQGGWVGRHIKDLEDISEPTIDTVDSTARLLGDLVRDIDENFTECKDTGRKIRQIIPKPKTVGEAYGLVTRNYIDYVEETGQATYSDYRFVAIVGMKKE